MGVPLHRRQFDAFLSHAHADRVFVDELYRWLSEVSGLNIWYDAKEMAGGDKIGAALQRGVEASQALLLVASPEAIQRGWVIEELDVARVERGDYPDFRIVPLRLGNAEVANLIKGQSWIELSDSKLTAGVAAEILRSFYPGENRPDPRSSRDVYVSGSWQPSDNTSVKAVSRLLMSNGFRLVGDAKKREGFKGNWVQSIIESCGAFVGVVPYRDNTGSATAADKPYKHFLTEIKLAEDAGLPTVVIADPRVRRADGPDDAWIRMDTQAQECPPEVEAAVSDLWDRWMTPPHPHHVFLAVDLPSPGALRDSDLRRLIERVTGMPTIVGNEIQAPDIPLAIMQTIREAFLVIADLSGTGDDGFSLNASVEAGMALASGVNLIMTVKGRSRNPPFMLRRGGQLPGFRDEVEQLGVVHKHIREYRRRVLNAEINRE